MKLRTSSICLLLPFLLLLLLPFTDAQFGNFFRNLFGGGQRAGRQSRPSGGQQQQRGGSGDGCRGPANPQTVQFQGRNYIPTWNYGCTTFSGQGAAAHCRALGMRSISLDNPAKTQWAMGLLGQSGQPWMWTSGQVSGGGVQWSNGNRQNVNQISPWSHTGGLGTAQPDNREGNENCLAVLNNFYQDGIKFHDVACHHEKPTICEQ